MIYFTAHTFNCVCHCIRAMFRVLGMYNFGGWKEDTLITQSSIIQRNILWVLSCKNTTQLLGLEGSRY